MNKNTKSPLSVFSVICGTVGHNYRITRKVTNHINEYKCVHCGREVSENASGTLEDLTQRLRNVNNTLATFFQKKTERISA
jgi:hypothetical protein